jgi:DUF1680 family protein
VNTALGVDQAAIRQVNLPQPSKAIQVEPFDLKEVRLLDGPFRQAMVRDQDYLLSLEPDRLLHAFRVTAGLPSTAAPYGGWEDPKGELRGHSLGHYLSACALMYSSTGDARFKQRTETIVTALAQCQDALPSKGFNKGYLAAFPESFFDRVDAQKPVWAPYYTLHKIMAGLLDTAVECDNPQALAVLERMADWLEFRLNRLTPEQQQGALRNEFGGMGEVMANLYAISGKPAHLKLARAFDHAAVFDPLARGEDRLNGIHANTQIPKMIAAAREFEVTGEPRYHDIASNAWHFVAETRSYVIGGHSDHESFFPTNEFAKHLSAETTETCNTYNMLKLTRHLFEWNPSSRYMDFYERGLYNHILASQDPLRGMFTYLVSLKPGHFKTYSTPFDSFWCCVGTGMENHAKYADTIFMHGADSLYVNLFIASELNWQARGLVVRQETTFPNSDTSKLIFKCDKPQLLTLHIRKPAWAEKGMTVSINGKKADVNETSTTAGYWSVLREWRDGDRVELQVPMTLHCEPLPGETNTLAVLYGPLVLAGELGTEGLKGVSPFTRNQLDQVHIPTPPETIFTGSPENIVSHIHRVKGKTLKFRTDGLCEPRDVTLIPFYRMHYQRYNVYWKVYSMAEWQSKKAETAVAEAHRRDLESRTIDHIQPGEQQPETDHKLQSQNSNSGEHMGRKWRDASNGGWFSYQLKVTPNQPAKLICTYWGDDAGARRFDILVDGKKLATQVLERNQPGQFFEVEYPLSEEWTHDKSNITVTFQATPGNFAGGLFGISVLKH